MQTETHKLPQSPEQPGLSMQEYLEILQRRRWLLIVPSVLVFIVVFIVTVFLPNKYESQAMILIEQPEIAADLVRTTVTGAIEQRLEVIGQRVLSRENLRGVIEKYDLFAQERETESLDSLVRIMRNNIRMQMAAEDRRGRVNPNALAFTLTYESDSPTQAQQVVDDLANLFLQENVLQRQESARETTRFLGQEAARLSREIVELEQRLAAFKEANMNSLPEMQNLNMNQMQRTEEDLRRNDQDVRALNERITLLQGQLAEMNPSRHLDRLRALEAEYASLAARFTERHPDRVSTRRELESLRNEIGTSGVIAPGNNPAYDQLQSQLQSALTDRRLLLAAREELRQKLEEIENRLSLTPVIEVDYRSLTREHETAIDKLRDLRAKQLQAELAESLEAESKSERFVLIRSASLPSQPTSPNRPVLMFLGLVFSVGTGLGAVVARESLDNAVHGPKGVARVTGMPVIAMIPVIRTAEDWTRIRLRWLLVALATITLIGGALALVHYQLQPLDEFYFELLERVGFEADPLVATDPEGIAQ